MSFDLIWPPLPQFPVCISDLSTFLIYGTHKLIVKILQPTKKYIFCWSDKKLGIILIDLQKKSHNSNYLPFLLKSDFLKKSGACTHK